MSKDPNSKQIQMLRNQKIPNQLLQIIVLNFLELGFIWL